MKRDLSIPYILQFIDESPKGDKLIEQDIDLFFDSTVMGLNIRDTFVPWDYAILLTKISPSQP